MRAIVYHGAGKKDWETVPDPELADPTDAIIRVDAVTICGTDLHILGGDVPAVEDGRILGHEAVGTVVATGPAVSTVRPGDRVLASCISACGRCRYCREGAYGQCLGGGGWILGHRIDGVQAEYARIPFADTSTYRLPDAVSSEHAVMLADILPTSYEVGVLNGRVRPGDVVAVVGAGPIGLAAVLTAKLYSPSAVVVIDPAGPRRAAAERLGARAVDPGTDDPAEVISAMTGGLGADTAMEAVGIPSTFELCTRLVRPGGHVANIGVHGKPATLHLEDLWIRNVTVTTGLVDTFATPTLLRLLAAGQLDVSSLITHRFRMADFLQAYDVFADPASSGALKVLITAH
ncbi:MAG TPA: zinc-dependent alcohol dehydrogenase family protein [Mycobacteriales bacterium]|nr:zinc-dependent alcohol dehydrogenase family protein [Mycobacteriales bacterium]